LQAAAGIRSGGGLSPCEGLRFGAAASFRQRVKMAKDRRQQSQVPLMYAFRDAFKAGDARKTSDVRVDGERVISGRSALRRGGAGEAALKENLAIDLVSLVNTIDLGSVVDLDDLPYVAKSVLNYGLDDIAHLTSDESRVSDVGRNLLTALLEHEPRLKPETLHVERETGFDDVNQRIRLNVAAEMSSNPFDVPVEFVAEVDVGSGKVLLSRLPIPT
jgi:type VI secretion system protein ImpF